MPNRILRDWTDSEAIDILSVHAERFFTRLIMKVDDYGRYSANVKILKSLLFPLKTDIREADVSRWLTECKESGLIALYSVASKEYLQIMNFKQVLRQKVEKYPAPELADCACISNDKQMNSTCIADASLKRNEEKPETEVEGEGEKAGDKSPVHPPDIVELFKTFQDWIKKNAPNVAKMKYPFTIEEYIKIRKKFNSKAVTALLLKMHNYKPLLKKNNSAYLTLLNWSENPFNNEEVKNDGPNKINPAEEKGRRILDSVE